MKKLLFLSLFFCVFFSCASKEKTIELETKSLSNSEASYNVNIYDARGDWYETGLLIESFDNKAFVKINNERYELLKSDKEGYRYMIEIQKELLYIK